MNKILFRSRQSCLKDKSIIDPSNSTCLICQDLPCHPLKCKCCKSIFCELCTIKWKESSLLCPNRCSQKWMLEKIEFPDIKLQCPYSQNCANLNIQEFQDHLLTCTHAPKEVKKAYKLTSQYLCINQHKLRFNSDRFPGQYQTKCQECRENKFCRNQCKTCKHFYCGECRLPPLTKKYCPGGEHQYINKNPHPGLICGKCKLQPLVLGLRCYDDMSCDFSLCQICYNKLPDPKPCLSSPSIFEEGFKAQWLDQSYWQKYQDPDFIC